MPCKQAHTVSCSFAIPPFKSSINSLVKIDLLEVSPLSRGILFQSLSVLITRSAFAFSSVPYPRFCRLSLRSAFRISERARAYHVSRNQPCRLGAAYPPAVLFVHVFPAYRGTSDCTPFGSGLSATLAWFPLTTFNSDLLTFTMLHKPSSPARRCFQLFASASRLRLDPFGRATFSRHASSRPLPAASVTIDYC